MITFKNNKDNHEYLIMNIRTVGGILLFGEILPTFTSLELEKMYFQLPSFEKEIGHHVSEVTFRKDSLLGNWLMENFDQQKIIYENSCAQLDSYISHEKIENAIAIAILENNKIVDKIIPLFSNNATGDKRQLLEEYEEDVLDYILEHGDFRAWSESANKEIEQYVVFEDGKYSKKLLSTEKVLEKIS